MKFFFLIFTLLSEESLITPPTILYKPRTKLASLTSVAPASTLQKRGTTFSFQSSGDTYPYALERSFDLTNWVELARNTMPSGGLRILIDCNATNSFGFYRLKKL